jgi:four helix bundle protein
MKTELQNRLNQLSKDIFAFIKKAVQVNYMNQNIVDNLLKSWWEVSLNYLQANSATTKKAFIFKINQSKGQLYEIHHRLDLLAKTEKKNPEIDRLIQESNELGIIFNKISRKLKLSDKTTDPKEVAEIVA